MPDDTDIREQVAAFLAGDLDAPAAEALQGRIDAEPWVARLADEMADMLVELGRVDEVPVPEGFSERLRAGLEAEIGRPLAAPLLDPRTLSASGAAAATGWAEDARPRSRRDAARPDAGSRAHDSRPRGGRNRLRDALAVAAVLAVLAVAGVGVLTQGGTFGGEDSGDTAFQGDDAAEVAGDDADTSDEATDAAAAAPAPEPAADAADEPAEESAATLEEDTAEAQDEGLAAGAASGAGEATEGEEHTILSAPTEGRLSDGPAVLTLGPLEDDDDAIAEAVGGHPAAESLRGTSAADVAELAAAYRDELLRGPDFDDGTPAGVCLTDTLDAAGQDLVPAVAARLDLPDGDVVAYALLRSRDGDALDATDVWVLDLPGCSVDRVIRQG